MNVNHHISDRLLAEYASGTLAEGWSLAVATHLALCPECRARLTRFEAAAGELLEEAVEDDAGMDDAWSAMRRRLAEAPPVREAASPVRPARPSIPAAGSPVIPEPLRSYLNGDVEGLQWKPIGLGAYQIRIPTADDSTMVRLLRIPAGKPVPEHGHQGRELTLVLAGAFVDGDDYFGRGDIEEADEEMEHQPVADVGEDCICLAVTDAPLRFKSRLLRLAQPLLGI